MIRLFASKSFLITVFLIIFSQAYYGQAQNTKSEALIRNTVISFVDNIKAKNMNKAVAEIYPKYFDVVPRSQVLQMLAFTYNNPMLINEIQNFKITKVDEPELIGKEYYSVVDYFFTMKLKVNWSMMPNNEKMKGQISKMLTQKFGANNVKYSSNGDYYIINSNMKACAISLNQKVWKLVILEPLYKKQLTKILPSKIMAKF